MNEVKVNMKFTQTKMINFLVNQELISINSVDEDGETLAHYASKREDIELLEFLVEKRIDLSMRNNDGFTAIERITYIKDILELHELYDFISFISVYNYLLPRSNFLTLEVKVMLAIHFQDLVELKKYLNEQSIDLNKIIENYGPFSFKASKRGNIEIVKLLKEKGCDFQNGK